MTKENVFFCVFLFYEGDGEEELEVSGREEGVERRRSKGDEKEDDGCSPLPFSNTTCKTC